MIPIFLQQLATDPDLIAGSALGAFAAVIAAFFVIILIVVLAMWIFLSLAFMKIAKKLNQTSPGLAWIPGIGPILISFRAAKMHWWPWLLLAGSFIPVIGIIPSLAFSVFAIIWMWKMFEAIGKPGWWAILCLIPIVNIILIAIAAWGK